MKAITITEDNVDMLVSRFLVLSEDKIDRLPVGYILVTDFGNDETFDVLTKAEFDYHFVKGEEIENGFISIRKRG